MQPVPQPPDALAKIRWWLQGGAQTVVMLIAVGNLALYPVARLEGAFSNVYTALWDGMMFGQASLLAIWLGLGPPRAVVRVVSAGVAFLVLGGAYLTGYLASESFEQEPSRFEYLTQQLTAILALPILLVTAAAPLWLLRLFFGWHIRRENSPAVSNSRQFSIGDLVLITTLVAVLLGGGLQAVRFGGNDRPDYWWVIAGWSLGSLIFGAAVLVPAALLISRYSLLGIGVLAVIAAATYSLVAWFVLQIIFGFFQTLSTAETWGAVGVAGCPFLGFFVTLCLPLVAVRRCGYRLVLGGGRR